MFRRKTQDDMQEDEFYTKAESEMIESEAEDIPNGFFRTPDSPDYDLSEENSSSEENAEETEYNGDILLEPCSEQTKSTEQRSAIVSWSGEVNLDLINNQKTIEGNNFSTIALKNIQAHAETVATWSAGKTNLVAFLLHEMTFAPTYWTSESPQKFGIITGSIGIITTCKIESITNLNKRPRQDVPILHLKNFHNSVTESLQKVPELDDYLGKIIVEAELNICKLQNIVGQRVRLYLRPQKTSGQYIRVTALKELLDSFISKGRKHLPLSTAKVLQVIHSRRNGNKTSKPCASTSTDYTF